MTRRQREELSFMLNTVGQLLPQALGLYKMYQDGQQQSANADAYSTWQGQLPQAPAQRWNPQAGQFGMLQYDGLPLSPDAMPVGVNPRQPVVSPMDVAQLMAAIPYPEQNNGQQYLKSAGMMADAVTQQRAQNTNFAQKLYERNKEQRAIDEKGREKRIADKVTGFKTQVDPRYGNMQVNPLLRDVAPDRVAQILATLGIDDSQIPSTLTVQQPTYPGYPAAADQLPMADAQVPFMTQAPGMEKPTQFFTLPDGRLAAPTYDNATGKTVLQEIPMPDGGAPGQMSRAGVQPKVDAHGTRNGGSMDPNKARVYLDRLIVARKNPQVQTDLYTGLKIVTFPVPGDPTSKMAGVTFKSQAAIDAEIQRVSQMVGGGGGNTNTGGY